MKAPSPESIQNWARSLAWKEASYHITALFKDMIKQGFIPERWKKGRTSMPAKLVQDDYTLSGFYRPIVLLNTLGKLFEKP